MVITMTSSAAGSAACRTWFVTGATSGIGQAVAASAVDRGDNVVALARHPDRLKEFTGQHPEQVLGIEADIRDEQSVRAAVDQTLARYGRIDVVANNAGVGLFGAVEEASDAQVRAIFDTNVFGVLNVLRATLPVLRKQRCGHVLQGSSYYGQTAHPGVGILAATKYAVEGLTDALAGELAPLGIKVTLIQPGPTATAFLSNLDHAATNPDYDETVREVQEAISALPPEAFNTADRVAAAIMTVVDAENPPLRLATGSTAANNMRTALQARLNDLTTWTAVTNNVDTPDI
jgi:NAD(P)-dependent dehydrogenase (short-subunit alcohol dehydrogenase family)